MTIKRFTSSIKNLSTTQRTNSGTGGEITFADGYTYHTFTREAGYASGTFTPNFTGTVEVLVVAGGGGGGAQVGGGGGAGGLTYNGSYSVTSGTGISYTIGNFGVGGRLVPDGTKWNTETEGGLQGSNSNFGSITTIGGGGGGGYTGGANNPQYSATTGGSGGGGGGSEVENANTGASGTGGQGYAGGNGQRGGGSQGIYSGGGGGGAGGAGQTALAAVNNQVGQGGVGLQYFGKWYAAGGNGCNSGGPRVYGSNGIGGHSGYTSSASATRASEGRPGDGMPGTGSGGGGTRDTDRTGFFNINAIDYSGFGGSGVVVVRYKTI